MKNLFQTTALLISLSMLLSSCNKESTSSITGIWVRSDYEVYVNGEKEEKDEITDGYFDSAPGSIQFNKDGTGILGSIVHFTYKQNGNSITLSAPGTGTDGMVLEKVGNRLIMERGLKSVIGTQSHINVFYEKQ